MSNNEQSANSVVHSQTSCPLRISSSTYINTTYILCTQAPSHLKLPIALDTAELSAMPKAVYILSPIMLEIV